MHVRGLGICAPNNPDVIDAAWKFIRFISSNEAEKEMGEVYVDNGYGNYRIPKRISYMGIYNKLTPKQWTSTLTYAFDNLVPAPYGKNCQAYILRVSELFKLHLVKIAFNREEKIGY